jgi:hypothetical protein
MTVAAAACFVQLKRPRASAARKTIRSLHELSEAFAAAVLPQADYLPRGSRKSLFHQFLHQAVVVELLRLCLFGFGIFPGGLI